MKRIMFFLIAIALAFSCDAQAADTYTPSCRIVQMPTGSNDTLWGVKANAAFAMLEQCATGITSIAVAGSNITLTTANNAADQARNLLLVFTGAPGTTRTVTMPNILKTTNVVNNTDSSLTFTAGAGATVTVTSGGHATLYTDAATNVIAQLNISSFAATTLDDTSAAATRTTLGLGTASTATTGTSGHTLPFLDGANSWSGVQTFGDSQLVISGLSSGGTTLRAPASGGGTATLFQGSDTILGAASVATLTNKTFDTAGSGNALSINGVAISTVTGTGSVVLSTSPTLVSPALGTPSALVLTNATGLPVAGLTGLGTGIGTFLATPTSANLAAALTNETGTGNAVFSNSPALTGTISAVNLSASGTISTAGITSSGSLTLNATNGNPIASNIVSTNANYISLQTTGGYLVFGEDASSPILTVGGTAYSAIFGTYNLTKLHLFTNTVVALTIDTVQNVGIGITSPARKLDVVGTFGATGAATLGSTLTLADTLTYAGVTLANAVTGTGSMVLSTSPTLVSPALGTPSALVLTNATGLPVAGLTGLGTGIGTFLATPTSANLAAALTNETGTGNAVFATSPTLTTPVIASIVNTGTLTLPTSTDTLVGRATTDTLTNKSISGSTNTLSAIANASLTNSSITVAGHAISLGGSSAVAAADLSNGTTGTGAVALAGSPTFTGTVGAAAITATGATTSGTFVPTSSSAPTNGMYLSAANHLDFATNSTNAIDIDQIQEIFFNGLPLSATGFPLYIKAGTNAAVGNFTCTGTTPVSVFNTQVAVTDGIFFSLRLVGGTVGAIPTIKTITSGSFTVACTSSDTSTYNYYISAQY